MSVSRYKKVKIEKKVPFFKRKESFVFLFLLVCGLVTIIGSSYAVFTMLVTGNKGHSVMAGTFKVEFEESETIQLLNTYPMSDEEGLKQKGYTFTITNVGTVDALYRVRMVDNEENTLGTDFIRFVYQKNSTNMGEPVLLSSVGSVIETNQTLAPSESATYTLKMWLKEEAGNEVQGTLFQSKIVVDAVQKIDGEFDDLVGPVVTLNGEKYPTVLVNTAYTDPGVSSIVDNVDGIISTEPNITYEYFDGTNTTVVNGIDTSKVGIYYIYYRGSDLNGNMGVAVRVLRVVNELSTPPTITLTGEDFVRKGIGSTYTEEGATAVDADGVNLTDRVITVGSINTRIPGTYFIKYFVIDRSNNISSVIRQIQVVEFTQESCFTFDSSTGTISDYLCVAGNTSSLPVITNVVIPDTIGNVAVQKIGASAFREKQLTSVSMPDSITSLGRFAFAYNSLTNLVLPRGLTSSGHQAFQNNQIHSVVIPSNITSITDYCFQTNQISSLVLHDGITYIGPEAFNNNQLPDKDAFIYWRNSDGSIDYTQVISYGGARRSNVVVPNGVKVLGTESMGNNSITSITLPEGLTTIGAYCFGGYSSLSTVTIPSTVTSIGTKAFNKNTNSNPSLTKIINKTGKSFDFGNITGGIGSFVSGTVTHSSGNITVSVSNNENIVATYQYNASNCITGEESTCQAYTGTTYEAGTIVKYKVNDSETKYFHVISENKEKGTLTMQQRENTIYSTKWYDVANDNTKGPLTVLPALENATKGWKNVKDQTYTMGSTPFQDNAFTGCTYDSTGLTCTTNTYTLSSRKAKARIITAQEIGYLGCTSNSQSCPAWLNNYLYKSSSYGGTVSQTGGDYGSNYGYWIVSAYFSGTTRAMIVYYTGRAGTDDTTNSVYGARAVVEIDK